LTLQIRVIPSCVDTGSYGEAKENLLTWLRELDLDAELDPFNRTLFLANIAMRMRNSRIGDPEAAFSIG